MDWLAARSVDEDVTGNGLIPGHHNRQRALPLPGSDVSAELPRYGILRHTRDDVQFDYEVRRRHPQGFVRQFGALGRHYHVSGHRRSDAEGDNGTRAAHYEDQSNRAARKEILGVDRWLDPRQSQYVPADVDL